MVDRKMRVILFVLALVSSSGLIMAAWFAPAETTTLPGKPLLAIPRQSDWVDCGAILQHGKPGEWDYHLWGGFTNTVVKRGGIFYLYYQGAAGYDDDAGTVTWRAIGVATSRDGIHFSKYEHNPVLTWFPNNNLEEGAVSAGAFVEESGEIALYYGANTWVEGALVHGDGRLALSSDGFHFDDLGLVLDHAEGSIWGSGDELFPVAGVTDSGQWFLYYIPNGTPQGRKLGVAWGESRDALTQSSSVTSNWKGVSAWGTVGLARVGEERLYAVFLNDPDAPGGPAIEARTVSLNTPNVMSAPVARYQFDQVQSATIMLDNEENTWYMFYRTADLKHYGAMVAAADDRNVTCSGERQHLPLIRQG